MQELGYEYGDSTFSYIGCCNYSSLPQTDLPKDTTSPNVAGSINLPDIYAFSEPGDNIGRGNGAQEVTDEYRCNAKPHVSPPRLTDYSKVRRKQVRPKLVILLYENTNFEFPNSKQIQSSKYKRPKRRVWNLED
jgi:hypothetical protein